MLVELCLIWHRMPTSSSGLRGSSPSWLCRLGKAIFGAKAAFCMLSRYQLLSACNCCSCGRKSAIHCVTSASMKFWALLSHTPWPWRNDPRLCTLLIIKTPSHYSRGGQERGIVEFSLLNSLATWSWYSLITQCVRWWLKPWYGAFWNYPTTSLLYRYRYR